MKLVSDWNNRSSIEGIHILGSEYRNGNWISLLCNDGYFNTWPRLRINVTDTGSIEQVTCEKCIRKYYETN